VVKLEQEINVTDADTPPDSTAASGIMLSVYVPADKLRDARQAAVKALLLPPAART